MEKNKITVLCEGSSDASFIRRFLTERGYDRRQIHVRPFPQAQGSGEQFVREHFPQELVALRQWKNRALIVMLDADTLSVAERERQLNDACAAKKIPAPTAEDATVFVIPKRNSETWFKFLLSEPFSEMEEKFIKQSDNHERAKLAAKILNDLCFRKQKMPSDVPSSLLLTCNSWKRAGV
jgi:hypothetical protein